MDPLKAIQTYIIRMLDEVNGMKVLLLDAHTTPIVSLAMTQTDLLQHQVYLTDRIDNPKRQPLPHLSCISFVRPCKDSIQAVKREIQGLDVPGNQGGSGPRYGDYWFYFSNVLTKAEIEEIALVDEFQVVKEVQEYFADYLAHYSSLVTMTPAAVVDGIDDPPNPPIYLPLPLSIPPPTLTHHTQAVISLLLSLKKKPVIRWEKMSLGGRKLAQEVQMAMNQPPYRELFGFKPTAGPAPLLLILDRRNDPVTPLLTQWTYQAMVHELIGINNGRVTIEAEAKQDLKDLILSPSSDPFYAAQLFSNFGDLGAALSSYVQSYQTRTRDISNPQSIETLADMRRFVEEYPEFKKLGGNVAKHVALVGELSRMTERDDLLSISEVEQSLASNESHAADLKSVMGLISSQKIPAGNKLRLAILYALRYQKFSGNSIANVVDLLIQNGISADRARLVYVVLNLAGADQRQDDLFMNENIFSRGKSALKGLKGVENVYTQHTPHLSQTLDLLIKGRLRETSYPFVEGDEYARTQRPSEVIVFMLGGTTYEESRAVALLNSQSQSQAQLQSQSQSHAQSHSQSQVHPGGQLRVVLGGTCVHNSTSFLDMLKDSAEHYGPGVYAPPPGVNHSSTLSSLPTSTVDSTQTDMTSTPATSTAGQSGINLRAGGYELSVGGAAGSGLYRSATEDTGIGATFQMDGLRDGARSFFGNLRDRVGETVQRVGTPRQE